MAPSVNSDFFIYNDQAQTAYLERLQMVLDVFNAASNNTIRFVNELIEGDFRQRAFYDIGGEIVDRDVNSNAPVDIGSIGSGEHVGVKKPWKYLPIAATLESFARRARSIEEFSQLVGYNLADATMKYWINAATTALNAAIRTATPSMVVTGKTISTDGKKVITSAFRKFGDRFPRIAALVMHSSSYIDFMDQAIDNKVYEEAGVVIYGGNPGTMGKPVVMTDTCPVDVIFGLQPGAVTITESQTPVLRQFEINDIENLAVGIRAEGVFNVELLGYSWDMAAGGKNPTMEKLGNQNSWEKVAKDNKATAGVIIDLNGKTS